MVISQHKNSYSFVFRHTQFFHRFRPLLADMFAFLITAYGGGSPSKHYLPLGTDGHLLHYGPKTFFRRKSTRADETTIHRQVVGQAED